MNVHVPSSGDRPEVFDKVIKEALSLYNEWIVIVGDWNVAFDLKIDSNHPANTYQARRRKKDCKLNECSRLNLMWTELGITILESRTGGVIMAHREVG